MRYLGQSQGNFDLVNKGYVDEIAKRLEPLIIEVGIDFPSETATGTISNFAVSYDTVKAAMESGSVIELVELNGNRHVCTYFYDNNTGVIIVRATTHTTNESHIRMLVFAQGTSAVIWQSNYHILQEKLVSGTNIKTINGQSILGSGNLNISGGSTGGGASIPVVSTEEELDTLSQNKGDLAVILSDDAIKEVIVPALDLHQATSTEVASAVTLGTGFTTCDSITGIAIDTEMDVPPCLPLAGKDVVAIIAARGCVNDSDVIQISFGTLDTEGYFSSFGAIVGSSGAVITLASYDTSTNRMVLIGNGLEQLNEEIALMEDPVWVYLSPNDDTFWDNIDEETSAAVKATFAFLKAKVDDTVFGTKSIRVKNAEGYSRLDSDVIRVIDSDMISALNNLDMPLGSLVRVNIPEHYEYDRKLSVLRCGITDPAFDASNASVIKSVDINTSVPQNDSWEWAPYFKLSNIDNTETILVDWQQGNEEETMRVLFQHSVNGETSEKYLLDTATMVWDEDAIAEIESIIESGLNIALEVGKLGNNYYNPATGNMLYVEDGTDTAVVSIIELMIGVFVTFKFNERLVPESIEKYGKMSRGWVKETTVSEWTAEALQSSDPIEAQLVYKTFVAYEKEMSNKQEKLVSGQNIATVNGQDLLAGGDIVIEGGSGGSGVTIDGALSTTSTNPVQNAVVTAELNKKVNVESGKGLSTNDYTNSDMYKLSGIATGAQVNVQSDWNATSGDAFIKNKPTFATINGQRIDQGGEIVIGGDEGAQVVLFDATCAQYPYDLPELTTTTDVQSITDAIALNQPIYIQFAAALCPATEASLVNGSPHLFLHLADAEDGIARMIHIYAYDVVWTWETFEMELGGASGDYVRSVNGVTPDDNGNVQIEVNIDGEVVDTTLSSLVGSGSTFTLEELVG